MKELSDKEELEFIQDCLNAAHKNAREIIRQRNEARVKHKMMLEAIEKLAEYYVSIGNDSIANALMGIINEHS